MRLIDMLNMPFTTERKKEVKPPDERILDALPNHVKGICEKTGLSDYVVRKDLDKFIKAGQVVKENTFNGYRNTALAMYKRRNTHEQVATSSSLRNVGQEDASSSEQG